MSEEVRVVELTGNTGVEDLARLHGQVLGYTLNSRMGAYHLETLYRVMAGDKAGYVGSIYVGAELAGFVSGALTMDVIKAALMRTMTFSHWVNFGFFFLSHPLALYDLSNAIQISRPVMYEGGLVTATLSTIGVNPAFRGRGFGKKLVLALEGFFQRNGVDVYHLDTLITNRSARSFYAGLGFVELEFRADSVILAKLVKHE